MTRPLWLVTCDLRSVAWRGWSSHREILEAQCLDVGLTSFLSPAPASPHQISMSCSWCTIRASLNAHLTALSIAELSSEWWSFKAPPQNEVNVDIWNPAICLLFPLVEKALAVERAKQCLGMLPALSFIIVF
ncbi:hypothetical protein TcWFU_002893 [Taenia crassiceps]|uniref:Uncharacterized protein n=1 Tax=Taenia crassiceps TaxID=6207 RepID=A0ABR4QAC8_9CEST